MKAFNGWNHWRIDGGGTLIAAGLTAIAYLAHISPTLTNHDMAQARQVQYVAEQGRTRDLERSLYSAKDQLSKAQHTAANSQLRLEPLSELNAKLARLTELAAQHGLALDGIEAGTTTTSDRYSTVPIRATGRGTYRNCLTALQQMRIAMPDVGVAAVEINTAGVNVDTTVTIVLDLHWHAQPQPKTIKK